MNMESLKLLIANNSIDAVVDMLLPLLHVAESVDAPELTDAEIVTLEQEMDNLLMVRRVPKGSIPEGFYKFLADAATRKASAYWQGQVEAARKEEHKRIVDLLAGKDWFGDKMTANERLKVLNWLREN